MTPSAEESRWVERELQEAEDEGKPVFPLLLAGRRFFRLNSTQFEDVRDGGMPSGSYVSRVRSACSDTHRQTTPGAADGPSSRPTEERRRPAEEAARTAEAALREVLSRHGLHDVTFLRTVIRITVPDDLFEEVAAGGVGRRPHALVDALKRWCQGHGWSRLALVASPPKRIDLMVWKYGDMMTVNVRR
jgi:hypothetical protein